MPITKFGLHPDLVVVAKPLAAGLPLAAILAREEVAQAFSPGCMELRLGADRCNAALALKVLEILERPGFLAHVAEMGAYFRKELEKLRADLPVIKEVRGDGLMVAAELTTSGKSRGAAGAGSRPAAQLYARESAALPAALDYRKAAR